MLANGSPAAGPTSPTTGICPCDPGAGAHRLFGADDTVTGDRFEVVECTACGLARTSPQPTASELDRYYPSGYHAAVKRYRLGLDRSLSLVHRARIRRIERLTGGPGSVLDVGCGPGRLLDQMRRRGWTTRGTERSPDAARRARDDLGLDVRAEELDEIVAEGASFDAVVFWHVAEHVHDPAEALCDIARLLRPGGVLLVGVPNFGSLEARYAGAGWFHLDVPRHLFHFTPETLGHLLAEAGLEPVATAHLAPEYDVFSFVQSAENRLGLPANLLYDVVRRQRSRLARAKVGSALSVLAVVAAGPLALLGAAWAPLAAALGESATLTVYARRPDEDAGG